MNRAQIRRYLVAARVQAFIRDAGLTQKNLSERLLVPQTKIRNVIHGHTYDESLREGIARACGRSMRDLWPLFISEDNVLDGLPYDQRARAALNIAGLSDNMLAERLNLTPSAVWKTVTGLHTAPSIRQAIATAAGRTVEKLWPTDDQPGEPS